MDPPAQEFGLQILPDSRIIPYPSQEAAEAAQQRMRGWLTTKHAKLKVRKVQIGPWENA